VHVPDIAFEVQFNNSKKTATVKLKELVECATEFLETYDTEALLGPSLKRAAGEGDGHERFERLLVATGFADSPTQLFMTILERLERANNESPVPEMNFNSVILPTHFLLALFELLIPGDRIVDVSTVRQLERVANISVPAEDRDTIARVLEDYPVRLSTHTIRQMRYSPAVAYQYMPFMDETNEEYGQAHTWVGQFHRGILEQMYRNRVILVLNAKCPVYCRFCFRKHKECRNQKSPKQEHVKQALLYIKSSEDIKEVVLTGGDPFMNKSTLGYAIDGLSKIPHIRTLRVATRSVSYFPQLFELENGYWKSYLLRKHLELKERGKRLELATHFIHPDEVTIPAMDVISTFARQGIAVYVQTPFLGGCNDDGQVLTDLFHRLRAVGAEIHYIFMPCSPILGNRRYVRPLSSGLKVAQQLRILCSDRAIPHITTATPIGKMDWYTSGWAVERDETDPRYLWLRTPYTPDYFEPFAPILQLGDVVRNNSEGTLDARFMAEIGDDELLRGPRPVGATLPTSEPELEGEADAPADLEQVQSFARDDQRWGTVSVGTGVPGVTWPHCTRLEIDVEDFNEEKLRQLQHFLDEHHRICELVLVARHDVMNHLHEALGIIDGCNAIERMTCFRLRSLDFNYAPERFSITTIRRLAERVRLSPVRPRRLEIETQFLHASELRPVHRKLVRKLSQRGLTVYNSTPLLSGINDTEEAMLALSHAIRETGMEFHHCYVAGLPLQTAWNCHHPISTPAVIDIASAIRRLGSGREIPCYVILTALGEFDYGISSHLVGSDSANRALIALDALPLDELETLFDGRIDRSKIDEEGDSPIIAVPGLCGGGTGFW